MSYDAERIDCPVCGPDAQTPLYEVNGWTIVRCASCRMAMVNPRRKQTIEIYRDDSYFKDDKYYYDYEGNKSAYQKGFRSKLALISKHCPRGGKLLDVGAAYGYFMEEAARFGFEPFGVELSKDAAAHAARYGSVFNQSLLDVETDQRFDVVAFIDSLEHFEQPVDGLRKARELLRDDGIVAVMVPNIDSWFARIAKAKWHLLLPEEHLFYFTPGSLRIMFQKAGFEMLHMGSGGYGRSVAEIMHVVFRGKKLPLAGAEAMLRKIAFEINLGDIFAIARKSQAAVDVRRGKRLVQSRDESMERQTPKRPE